MPRGEVPENEYQLPFNLTCRYCGGIRQLVLDTKRFTIRDTPISVKENYFNATYTIELGPETDFNRPANVLAQMVGMAHSSYVHELTSGEVRVAGNATDISI